MSSPPTTPEGKGLIERLAREGLSMTAYGLAHEVALAFCDDTRMDGVFDKLEPRERANMGLGIARAAEPIIRAALTAQNDALQALIVEVRGYQHHLRECEQIAGKALGYPWFKDDQTNFPGATEADGVCIGEHVGDTIAEELANRYSALIVEGEEMKAARSQPGYDDSASRDASVGSEPSAAVRLRKHWVDFTQCDFYEEGFAEAMEAAGLVEWRSVEPEDLEQAFADELGIEPGGTVWVLTAAGQAALSASAASPTGVSDEVPGKPYQDDLSDVDRLRRQAAAELDTTRAQRDDFKASLTALRKEVEEVLGWIVGEKNDGGANCWDGTRWRPIREVAAALLSKLEERL